LIDPKNVPIPRILLYTSAKNNITVEYADREKNIKIKLLK